MVAHHGGAQQIVIVGGGLSGTALAIKLLHEARQALAIRLVEPSAQPGRGLAYSTEEPGHLVNGPALIFSLYPDKPEHFVDWLAAQPEFAGQPREAVAQAFAPRWRFGDYVNEELQRAREQALPGVTFEHVRARVDDIDVTGSGITLALDAGRVLLADRVVLALGVFQSRPRFDASGALTQAGRYVADVWDRRRLAALADAEDIVLIGASLTMIDAVVSLDKLGYSGTYRVLARHGLTPVERRNPAPAAAPFGDAGPPRSLRQVVRELRDRARAIVAHGGDWQALPGALRAYTAEWWHSAALTDRRRFFRHVRPHWDVFLHRAPPVSAALVAALRASGRLSIEAATVNDLAEAPAGRVSVRYRLRGGDEERTVLTQGVVNCTGPDYRWHAGSEQCLVRNLFARGLVQTGPVGLGIKVDASLAAVAADGTVSPHLSVLGAALRGTIIEPGTVVEIANQTSKLSTRLLAALSSPSSTTLRKAQAPGAAPVTATAAAEQRPQATPQAQVATSAQ
ncbi:MAG: FAD/NAD(P)-binding protein [Paraburkholderia sp.]|jgi:uncharacterized NAD(P)/FAD-binding protein YdhS|nr:FAD/NAD(P)-binding protein [Burkholderia sp. 4M9327F10]